MARKRMIDPRIWDSEQVMSLTPAQFKLYIYLISQADDSGRLKVCIQMFKSRVHPLNNYSTEKLNNDILEIEKVGLVIRYGETFEYMYHPNWKVYQKIDRPTPSLCPEPADCTLVEPSSSPRRALVPNRIEDNRIEENTLSGKPDVLSILEYLNQKTGRKYRDTPAHSKTILTRIKEGYTVNDFRRVIDFKVVQWGRDEKMAEYLRPETLFGTKFDSYLSVARNGIGVANIKIMEPSYPLCPSCGKATTGRRSGAGGGKWLYTCPCGGSVEA